jgi:hypothetical protein
VRHSVIAEKPSVEENSEGSWIVEVLKTLLHVCTCKRTPINSFIQSTTRYFRHVYHPICDHIYSRCCCKFKIWFNEKYFFCQNIYE